MRASLPAEKILKIQTDRNKTGDSYAAIAARHDVSTASASKYGNDGTHAGRRKPRRPPPKPRPKEMVSEHVVCKWEGGDIITVSLGLGEASALKRVAGMSGGRVPLDGYPRVEPFGKPGGQRPMSCAITLRAFERCGG